MIELWRTAYHAASLSLSLRRSAAEGELERAYSRSIQRLVRGFAGNYNENAGPGNTVMKHSIMSQILIL